jgi:hypothetical protein
MEDIMTKYALIPALALLAGCPTDDSGCDTAAGDICGDTDDTDTDTGPAEPAINYTWDDTGIMVELENIDTTGFDFGMAETIDMTNGWFGEDCLNGTAGYQECHVFTGLTGSLTAIYDEVQAGTKSLDDVQSGSTTLFEKSFEDGGRLTYVVTVDDGSCWVWGQDTTYYTGATGSGFESCEALQ